MPKDNFNAMACNSKLHSIILRRVISMKLNIDKNMMTLMTNDDIDESNISNL